MKDPNSIPEFLSKIQDIWSQCPDLKFGQLVNNVVNVYDKIFNEYEATKEEWIKAFEYYKENYLD